MIDCEKYSLSLVSETDAVITAQCNSCGKMVELNREVYSKYQWKKIRKEL